MPQSVKPEILRCPNRAEEKAQLQRCMEEVRCSINQAYTAFNMADDADWIESCVFEINALQARYNYLVRQMKWLEDQS